MTPRYVGPEPRPGTVLCLERSTVELIFQISRSKRGGFVRMSAAELRTLTQTQYCNWAWVTRDDELEQENGSTFLQYVQVIPYTVFVMPRQPGEHTKIWTYSRTKDGGEARLHGSLSVGVGGHVDGADATNGCDFVQYVNNACVREIEEEIECEPTRGPAPTPKMIGLIYLESRPVERAHLGVVYESLHLMPIAARKGQGVHPIGWIDISTACLDKSGFEHWSQVVLNHYSPGKADDSLF